MLRPKKKNTCTKATWAMHVPTCKQKQGQNGASGLSLGAEATETAARTEYG